MAEKEKAVQANINRAITVAPIGANKVPCRADSTMINGARAKAYQLGPPKIHNKCQIAAIAAMTPPKKSN